MSDPINRITYYLSSGGLFNPELANHEAVRDLLIECRDELAAVTQERDALRELRLEVQSRESEEARFYRYLRDEAGQLPEDHDGPMICSGLGDNFDYLRGEECDIALREAIDSARGKP